MSTGAHWALSGEQAGAAIPASNGGTVIMLSARSRRTRILIALLSVVVIAAAVIGIRTLGHSSATSASSGLSNGDGKTAPTSSSTPQVKPSKLATTVPTTAPKLTAQEKAASVKATTRLTDFLGQSASALGRNDGKADLAPLAAGPALGEIQALAQQYKSEDLKVTGAPKVLGSRVVSADLGARPASMTLAVCLDNRPVVVRNAKGHSLVKHRTAAELVVLNLYQLQEVDNAWLVVNHSIPADSSCKRIGISS